MMMMMIGGKKEKKEEKAEAGRGGANPDKQAMSFALCYCENC